MVDDVLRHLFGEWFSDLVGIGGMLFGPLAAFGLWCLTYTFSLWNAQRRSAIVLLIAGCLILWVALVMPAWTDRQMLNVSIIAGSYYLILRTLGPRRRDQKKENA